MAVLTLDAVAFDGVEALQCGSDGVNAWPEVDDAILACAVGDGGSGLFYQDRAGHFDETPGRTAPELSLTTPVMDP